MQYFFLAFLGILLCISPIEIEAVQPEPKPVLSPQQKKRQVAVRRKRSNTTKGREQAYFFLQSYEDLANLAGLPYKPITDTSSVTRVLQEDAEILTDEDIEEEQEFDDDFGYKDTEQNYTIEDFWKEWQEYISHYDADEQFTAAGIEKKALIEALLEWIGTPYWYGGGTKNGIDCSALVQKLYDAAGNIVLPRTARTQYEIGIPIESIEDLEFGDLVFFNTRKRVYVSHVGIYLGHSLFAHASSKYGVTISSLQSPYYKKRFIGARRLTVEDVFRLQRLLTETQ